MKLGHLLGHASGPDLERCCFLGYRYDASIGFVWDHLESWVLTRSAKGLEPLLSQRGWLTDLWRSPRGVVHVSTAGRMVRLEQDTSGSKWRREVQTLDAALSGVWGLDDSLVFAWGERGSEPAMFVSNGDGWRAIPSPGYVNGVHGIAPDLIYAVGAQGLLARWNGTTWSRLPSFTDTMLSRVFVVSPDEMYAVGAGKRLLEGTVHGWSEVLHTDFPLMDVAKHGGAVFVAAGPEGLFTLEGRSLKPFSKKVTPDRFDAREELLISARAHIVQLASGPQLLTAGMEGFLTLTEGEPAQWVVDPA